MLSFSFSWLKTTSCDTLEEGKNLNSRSPRFIFARHQTTLSFPSLSSLSQLCVRPSQTMMIASAASSSAASSSFCASAQGSGGVTSVHLVVVNGRKHVVVVVVIIFNSEEERTRASRQKEAKVVVVIGANGKTGKRCVKYAAENGWDVVAATRNGSFPSLIRILKKRRENE